ncbi:lysoplasmalogenase [Glycomyces terrestris]|uniref:Lysoplasmalogenase n=1 Tax=Glycomyces terrestris TaxID=2493553 RepID=A0A426UUL9_9ACTN|nr:lysoplasmalogenase family protein [Glycomyces terrestris]RRR97556.1 lysoplasmalogenase [Glycomyces terrestris]
MSPPLLLLRSQVARVRARTWLLAFAVVLAVELAAVALGFDAVRWVSKPLLTLLLLGHLIVSVAPGQAPARLFGLGLLVACAADTALLFDGTAAFLTGMGLFAVMQALYIAAFLKLGALRAFGPRYLVPTCYLAFWAGLITALWTRLGPLAAPVAVYSLLLVAMAALAAGLGMVRAGRLAGIGGALFVVSDLILGLGVAGFDLPGADLAVMSTYGAAQLLLVVGVRGHLRPPAAH